LTVPVSVAVPASLPRSQLLRVLGIAFGIAIIIGNTIIVGILRTPGEVAANLPNRETFLAAWLVGGIYALLGAASLAELGAMVPRSGGQYVLVHRALGPYPGALTGLPRSGLRWLHFRASSSPTMAGTECSTSARRWSTRAAMSPGR
jgi:amino acid transporter